MTSLLLWLTVLPLVGAAICVPLSEQYARVVALVTTVAGLVLAGVLWLAFDPASGAQTQLPFIVDWIPSLRIQFALGVDGLSFPLVLLTKLMMPIAILASWNETRRVRPFMISYLALDSAMTGTFLATDVFLFYVLWEAMLVPMILIIGVWGSDQRIYAAIKFFLFTFAGSILMLVAIFWCFTSYSEQFGFYSAEIRSFYRLTFPEGPVVLGLGPEAMICLAFLLAFAIKVPVFPLHTWLPDAHVQAPAGGSILLAAVLLKMGTYGILRFCVPIAPGAFASFAPALAWLSLAGILYGAWVAFRQTDMKKLVAYSSVSHLGFVTLGICAMNAEALGGAMLQMINHGLSTGALFFLVGALYERRHTRDLSAFGGLAGKVPRYAFFLMLVACSSMGVPGLNGFVGEFLVLLGTFQSSPTWGILAATGVIFAAVYTLWLLRQVLWGESRSPENASLSDLSFREVVPLSVLGALIVLLGVFPGPLVGTFRPVVDAFWSSSGRFAEGEAPSRASMTLRPQEISR